MLDAQTLAESWPQVSLDVGNVPTNARAKGISQRTCWPRSCLGRAGSIETELRAPRVPANKPSSQRLRWADLRRQLPERTGEAAPACSSVVTRVKLLSAFGSGHTL
jgi:hypothetical protein